MRSFNEVWSEILELIKEQDTILTITRQKPNFIEKVIDEGLLVSTKGDQASLVRKEWIKDAWNILNEKIEIRNEDLDNHSNRRSSFIMALLSSLDYVEADVNPQIIRLKEPNKYPYMLNSWTIISQNEAIKKVDKSCFIEGTGVPKDIRYFFMIDKLGRGKRKNIKLFIDDYEVPAYISMENTDTERTKMNWGKEFKDRLKEKFSLYYEITVKNKKESISYQPAVMFIRLDTNKYKIVFLSLEDKSNFDNAVLNSRKDSMQAREERLEKASKYPTVTITTIIEYKRNPDVVAHVLERAKGICEGCSVEAPFIRANDKTPYLEVHHKIPLSKGGQDTVENTIALCPNCHREEHYG